MQSNEYNIPQNRSCNRCIIRVVLFSVELIIPCKEQQPVIKGTITESCSMQQWF